MGTIKDINGRDLVVPEEIKKRWKECMEELYNKDPNGLSGGDDLLTRTCLSQRIFFIPLQKKRRGNIRKSAWCRAPIPISWM